MTIDQVFEGFNNLNVLIIGDIMIDAYYWGKVDRISPEAPVPIVTLNKKEIRLGGAANVAINIQALGATPILCTVTGKDDHSFLFEELLQKQGLTNRGIVKSEHRPTTIKTRVIGNNHQMLRIDEEVDEIISENERKDLVNSISEIIKSTRIDVIIFEDYDKGVISKELIESIVSLAKENNIPVTVDPKKRNFPHYKGVTLLKPNLKELREGLNTDLDNKDFSYLKQAVDSLQEKQDVHIALVTLSESGVYVSNTYEKRIIPAHIRNIADVSGAGDTVISVASLCLALKLDPVKIATLSNLAGGLVCEKIGVVAIDKKQLYDEARELYK